MKNRSYRNWPVKTAAGVAVVFGVLTILSGGLVLFGGEAAEAAAGNAVSFVVWFNFLSGFVYVLAGVGIAILRRWAVWVAILLTVAIAVVFAFFVLHILRGGAFEMRTVGAMTLRLIVWAAIAIVAGRNILAKQRNAE